MAENKLVCSSCKKRITNDKGAAIFKCPACGKSQIVRCAKCREIVAKYRCPTCHFEGPN